MHKAVTLFTALALVSVQAQANPEMEALIARVVADLPDSLTTQHDQARSLTQRMAASGVPAVSVAVFRDGGLVWSRAWGVRDVIEGGEVDVRTLFQAASISKPIAAMGALALSTMRKLDLDEDIGTSIAGWNAGAAITTRQLLSHSAGLGVSGFPGYRVGQPLPHVLQILTGTAPSVTPAVRVEGPIGGPVRYSGGGYVVLQSLIAARSGLSFEEWMQAAVLAPLGMHDSSFHPPDSPASSARAASGHRSGTRVPGRWHLYPESAAAGLWTTPTDLGRAAAALQDQLAGRRSNLGPESIARMMLSPQAGWFGLGWVLDTRSGEPQFGHTGLNEGFECLLVASAATQSPQHLVVVMTNGQGGTALAQAMLRAIAREMGWPAHAPRRVEAMDMPEATLLTFAGYFSGADRAVAVEVSGGVAHLRDGGWQRARLVPTSSSRFAVENRSFDLVFGPVPDSGSRTLTLQGDQGMSTVLQAHIGPLLSAAAPPILRGSHSAWKTDHAFAQTSDREWTLSLSLPAGEMQFKVAAGDWKGVTLGAPLASAAMVSAQTRALAPMGGNVRLTLERASECRFTASAPQREPATIRIDCE